MKASVLYPSAILVLVACVGLAWGQSTEAPVRQMLVTCVEGKNCSHVYVAGHHFLMLRNDDIGITLSVDQETDDLGFQLNFGELKNPSGRRTVAEVEVANYSKQPIDVLPADFTLEELEPKGKMLRYVTPDKMKSLVKQRTSFLTLPAPRATQTIKSQSTTNGTTTGSTSGSVTSYGSDAPTTESYSGSVDAHSTATTTTATTIPDPQKQAALDAQAASNRAEAESRVERVKAEALVATTVAPDARVQGEVWFEESPKMRTGILTIPINGAVYQFNLSW